MASTLFSDADRTSILDLKAGFMSNYRGSGDHLRRNRALEMECDPVSARRWSCRPALPAHRLNHVGLSAWSSNRPALDARAVAHHVLQYGGRGKATELASDLEQALARTKHDR